MFSEYAISNIRCITPDEIIENSSVVVKNKKILKIGGNSRVNYSPEKRMYLYPGLINIHDHFRGNYLPKVGPPKGTFYVNWAPWDGDLKSSEVYKERANISVEDCYELSAYKNIFSGVVTVNDHFPHELNSHILPRLPLRVIQEYTLAHECSSYDLNWGDGIEEEHKKAVEGNLPFITHLEEGFDQESQGGVDILEELNCLDEHGVFVHCIGFSDEDIRKTKKAGAHIAWCPASNIFMFNVTCKIKKMIAAGINISIGTDSTATGSVNLLEEMRFAREIYRRMYHQNLSSKKIVDMVTINPAKAFRMDRQIGAIAEGMLADLLLIDPVCEDSYDALVSATPKDIHLLLKEGTPILGDPVFEDLFKNRGVDYTRVKLKGKTKLVKGDPEGLLKRIQREVGFAKKLDFIPLNGQNV